jgi:hypothetical protein
VRKFHGIFNGLIRDTDLVRFQAFSEAAHHHNGLLGGLFHFTTWKRLASAGSFSKYLLFAHVQRYALSPRARQVSKDWLRRSDRPGLPR